MIASLPIKDLDVGGNVYIPAIIVTFVRGIGALAGTILIRRYDNKVGVKEINAIR
jgi:hypothetical protein